MKKKIIIALPIIILLAFFSWLYSAGYVPIIGNIIAAQKINAYANSTYGNDEKIDIGYDFYNMGDYNGGGYAYILNSNLLIDYNLYENAGDETPYKQDYQKIIDSFEEGITFDDFSISCTIDADDYTNKYYKLTVYEIKNSNILNESESETKPAEIVMQFIGAMQTKYNFTSVNVSYSDNNGAKQITLVGSEPLTLDILIENTKEARTAK